MPFFLFLLCLCSLQFSLGAFTPHLAHSRGITLEAEWIYFSPTSESSEFVITAPITSPFIVESREANRLDDFYSGYRVGAAYKFGCTAYAAVTWTDLYATNSTEIRVSDPTFTIPILVPPALFGGGTADTALGDFASDRIRFHYMAFEATGGQKLMTFLEINIIGLGGIHYARLDSKENFFYSIVVPGPGSFSGENRSKFWGLGPEMGLKFDRWIGAGFSICGTATGAFLIGPRFDKSFAEGFNDAGESINFQDATNQRLWRVVPYANIRMGINYDLSHFFRFCQCLKCLHGNFEIGYEVPVYFNALSTIRYVNSNQIGITIDDYRNVTMHGIHASLSLSF